MILAKTESALEYRGIHPNLDRALEQLTPAFLSSLGEEKVEMIPGEVWCTRFVYETTPEGSAFESHEKFLDIHLVTSGRERIQLAPPATLEETEGDAGKDLWLYSGEPWQDVILVPGDFLVTFPGDAHRLKLCVQGPETVSKVVFKVKTR